MSKKRFKTKKKNKKKYFYIFLVLISFFLTFNYLEKESINNFFISSFINDFTNNKTNIFKSIKNKISSPENIVYSSLNKVVNKENLSVFSSEDEDNYDYSNQNTEYVEDPNPKIITNPTVYIYNTHQLEEYASLLENDYNIRPNVLMASYILKEKLLLKNIPSIVETANIKEYIYSNNLKYKNSYRASRYFLEEAIKKYSTLNYFVDIHRDSAKIEKTLLKINDKEYARVLFVVGMEHQSYQKNLSLAEELNTKISLKLPNISRGISKKQGSSVNGIYNQDISPNSILIEIGGIDNTIEQVYNTIEVFSEVLNDYIRSSK